jgi:hypothetical protein
MQDRWEYRQEQIAQCMAEAGFEYYPTEWSSDRSNSGGSDSDKQLYDISFDVDHAAAHGFGFVEDTFSAEGQDADAGDLRNPEYAESLSHSEHLAYQEALNGETGCELQSETATDEHFNERVQQIDAQAQQLHSLITGDERFAGIDEGWKACMAERGWEVESILSFSEQVSDEIFARLSAAAPTDPEAPETEVDRKVVDELFEYERGAAVDQAECWTDHRDAYIEILNDAYASAG